jgi:hypothetical protein
MKVVLLVESERGSSCQYLEMESPGHPKRSARDHSKSFGSSLAVFIVEQVALNRHDYNFQTTSFVTGFMNIIDESSYVK